MVFIVQDELVPTFHYEGFQLPAPFRYCEIKIQNIFWFPEFSMARIICIDGQTIYSPPPYYQTADSNIPFTPTNRYRNHENKAWEIHSVLLPTEPLFWHGSFLSTAWITNNMRSKVWVIKFNGLFGDSEHRGPYRPYKPCNHSVHIGIIIVKRETELLIHSQTSTAAPLKFAVDK